MGEGKGRPCARGTSPSPHFGSFHSFLIGGLVRDTHERLLLLPNMSCLQHEQNSTVQKFHYSPTALDLDYTSSLSLHWVIGGHLGGTAGLVWFPSFSSSTDPAPLFRAKAAAPIRSIQKAGIFDACLPACNYKG